MHDEIDRVNADRRRLQDETKLVKQELESVRVNLKELQGEITANRQNDERNSIQMMQSDIREMGHSLTQVCTTCHMQ